MYKSQAPTLSDLDTARYKGRLQSRNPGMNGISLHIDQHTNCLLYTSFDHLLNRLCEPLEAWLDDHREPDETHTTLLQLYFDVRAWLRVAEDVYKRQL